MKKHEEYWKQYLAEKKKKKKIFFKELGKIISEKKKTYRKGLLNKKSDLAVLIIQNIQDNKKTWDILEKMMMKKFLTKQDEIERSRRVLPDSEHEPLNTEEESLRQKFEEDMNNIFESWKSIMMVNASNIN
jgi:hypothetical protein